MGSDLLDVIRHRINAGDREGARLELLALLNSEPDSADAWALLAILLKDPAEQVECYRQILRINPGDRQATAWLEALSQRLPKQVVQRTPLLQEHRTLQCTQCGSVTEVRFVGELQDKRAFCPHCGSHVDLPDTFQRVERRREEEQLPGGGYRTVESERIETRVDHSPGGQPQLEADTVDELLQKLNVPEFEDGTIRPDGEQEVFTEESMHSIRTLAAHSEQRSLMDRMLGRGGAGSEDEAGAAALDDEDGLSKSGQLTPEEILRMAGGPLPPEERQRCPKCGATVSHSESKCPWCSAPLHSDEGR